MTDPERADPLSDCLALLVQQGLDRDLCGQIIRQVRRRWGGGQVYIRAIDRDARDALIQAGLAAGEPVQDIARRAQVHPATVRRRRAGWL